jgi:glycosyltransferase involved in cell wall biosynthesis
MHGSNLMNQHVTRCKALFVKYDVKVIALHYARTVSDIGSFRIQKFFLLLVYIIRLARELRRFQPDLAYFVPMVTGTSFYRDCLFTAILKLFKVQIVYHLHGKGIKEKLSSGLLFRLYHWFFKDTFIIHLSPLLSHDIHPVVDFNQCWFLPNGIDSSDSRGMKPSIMNTQPTFLCLANLFLAKGILTLLETCQILAREEQNFKVYFVGNPSSELSEVEFLRIIKAMGISKWVEYLGPQYGKDKQNIFMNSDFFVFPSYNEAFPLVLLEAMAAGLPVVSTSEGAIPEIVEQSKTGFIVEKQNASALAEKMEFLLTHSEQAKAMGMEGRKKFKKCYTIEQFHKNLLRIFDELFSIKNEKKK